MLTLSYPAASQKHSGEDSWRIEVDDIKISYIAAADKHF
jgi:hypothetical protein